jgi:hypothetical protein
MSDTEEVVLSRKPRQSKDTKPEIAREKLKEKRERLKKEKENQIIEEAKKRLVADAEAKAKAEQEAKALEEQKKKSDPQLLLLEEIRKMLEPLRSAPVTTPEPIEAPKQKRQYRRKALSEIPVKEEKKPKEKAPKEPVAPKAKAPRKPRQRLVYEESPSNNFVGSAPVAPPQTVQIVPTNPLLNQLLSRRNMNASY